jgi:hypothetical protein
LKCEKVRTAKFRQKKILIDKDIVAAESFKYPPTST